jgi:hypothetical protein
MVSLGFIKNFEQCPPEARQVRILRSEHPLPAPGEAMVRIRHDDHGLARWGLDWSVCATASPAQWGPLLATRISKLGWNMWWLNVSCLARTMDLSPDKALEIWGEHFWNTYTSEALVLLDVGQQRGAMYQVVRHWEKRFPLVCFSSRHDYDDHPQTWSKFRK